MHVALTTLFADWHHDGHGWWIVVVPLFWIALIAGLVLVLRSRPGWGRPHAEGHRETALDVLDRRYARGEIDLDEYRERRAVLRDEP
jgi:putative membrane protein